MITKIADETSSCNNGAIYEHNTFYGLSTDDKPTDCVQNADVFYEMDTKKVFLYDAQNARWLEQ